MPGTFDDVNPDARILTPWTLTPCGLWRRKAIGPFDAPAFWRPQAFDAPITSGWPLTPQQPQVAFDAPIPPGGIWRPNTPGWHLTPQYLRVAFDTPIPLGGIWRPEQFFFDAITVKLKKNSLKPKNCIIVKRHTDIWRREPWCPHFDSLNFDALCTVWTLLHNQTNQKNCCKFSNICSLFVGQNH